MRDADLLTFALSIAAALSKNGVKLADANSGQLTTAIDAYEQTLIAQQNGGRMATERKRRCRKALEEVLTALASAVEDAADGDREQLLASGFMVRTNGKRQTETLSERNVEVQVDSTHDVAGEIKVQVKPETGIVSYLYEFAVVEAGQALEWQHTMSGQRIHTLKNLESGRQYKIRVCALRRNNALSNSNEITRFCL